MTPAEVLAVLDGTLVVLRACEWAAQGGTEQTSWGCCPDCGAADWNEHKKDCQLVRQIEEHQQARAAVSALVAERDDLAAESDLDADLIRRQGDLLIGVVDAIKGPPPEDTIWSVHDAVELAAKVVAERDALRSAGNRVTAAFKAMGESRAMYGTLTTLRRECEDAMTALDAALSGAGQ